MRIAIINCVSLNGGDAAILEAEVGMLTAAFGSDVTFAVYDDYAEAARRYYPTLAYRRPLFTLLNPVSSSFIGRIRRRARTLRLEAAAWCMGHQLGRLAQALLSKKERECLQELADMDMVVVTGGTALVENYHLSPRIAECRFALLLRRPLVFFPQSLGPFKKSKNRRALRKIFDASALILLRDEKSSRHLKEIGVRNHRVRVLSDSAFALTDPAISTAATGRKVESRRLRIAISVRDWPFFKSISANVGMERYLDAIRALTAHLVEMREARVTFLSTCQGIPEYWTDDSRVAERVFRGLPREVAASVAIDKGFRTPNALRAELRKFDVVVATRLHMAIQALMVGVPAFPISYEFKTHELFNRLGLGSWVQDIETLTPTALIGAFDAFLDALPSMRESLFDAVTIERSIAREAIPLVAAVYRRWAETGGKQGRTVQPVRGMDSRG